MRVIALVGNPNVGKTTLFNRLAGVRHRTANFPGTTQEALVAEIEVPGREGRSERAAVVDLPGAYGLDLDLSESRVVSGVLSGREAVPGVDGGGGAGGARGPGVLVLVLDAANLRRNLRLALETARFGLPSVVALNMIDEAGARGVRVEAAALEAQLGCPVAPVCARTGQGVETVRAALSRAAPVRVTDTVGAGGQDGAGADHAAVERAAARIASTVTSVAEGSGAARGAARGDRWTDRLDGVALHPVLGLIVFASVMTGLFWVVFRLAEHPMGWIEWAGAWVGGVAGRVLPDGAVRELVVDGVIAGVAGTVVFLPQICLLFFLIAVLEGTGYLARAALLIDRVMRPFGLSGHAFVPMLSAHACALPALMSARGVPDGRERLAVILSIPFLSCSARIPVYVLLTGLLFPGRPGAQAVAFTGCYALGAGAALVTAMIARRTVARGRARAMAIELPPYRVPDVAAAALLTWDRAKVFLTKAGTLIVCVSIVLWWLGAYPKAGESEVGAGLRAEAAAIGGEEGRVGELLTQADAADARHAAASSFLGRIGGLAQPVFAPLGADRQLTIGILASFAAREVFASTMAVQVAGTDDTEDAGVLEQIARGRRDDGGALFPPATSWAMLVYFVLAMQCLPTLVVTAREAGGWRWALVQFVWMSAVAYLAAAAVHAVAA